MPDGHEEALDGHLALGAGLRVTQAKAADLLLAQHVHDLAVPLDADLGVRHGTVLHDAAAAQLVTPVDEHDLARELGQEEGLLQGAVAAAHHGHPLVAEEEAVASGAGGDSATSQAGLVGQVKPDSRGPRGDDDAVRRVAGSARGDGEGSRREVDRLDVGVHQAGTEALGLGSHVGHQLGAVDALGEARVVLDLGGDHELSAGHEAGDDERLEVGARGVDGGRQAGRAAAHDEHPGVRSAAIGQGGGPVVRPARRRSVRWGAMELAEAIGAMERGRDRGVARGSRRPGPWPRRNSPGPCSGSRLRWPSSVICRPPKPAPFSFMPSS